MKKVLHVSHSLDTGGGPLYINKILIDLPDLDHYVAGNPGYFFDNFKKLLGENKVFRLSGKNILFNLFYLNKVCRHLGIDIIHCHGRGASLYSRPLVLLNRRLKVIYTVHGFHPDTLNPLFRWIYILYEKIFFKITDAIVNVSKSELKRFVGRIKPNDTNKLHYIPNYISEGDIEPQAVDIELDPTFINLVFIGRLSWEKGIDLLVDAWEHIRETRCRLYIIGYGPYEESLRHKDLPNLFFLGKIPNASSLMTRFDALVIPSRFEGMPFVGLEAMLLKVNVIASPATGVTDLFNDSNAWVATSVSAVGLQRALTNFIDDSRNSREVIRQKSHEGYRRVKKEFSRDNAEKLRTLYNSVGGHESDTR